MALQGFPSCFLACTGEKGLVFFNMTCNIQVIYGEANKELLGCQQIFSKFWHSFLNLKCTFDFAGHRQLCDLGPPGFLRKILQRSK